MTDLRQFKLLVLGAIDLLSLGSTQQHKEHGIVLARTAVSRDKYYAKGKFIISGELVDYLDSTNVSNFDRIIVCHHKGWGLKVMTHLPEDLQVPILVVDSEQEPTGYATRVATGTYGTCWNWIKGPTTVAQTDTLVSETQSGGDAPYCYKCAIRMMHAGSRFVCPSCAATSGCN